MRTELLGVAAAVTTTAVTGLPVRAALQRLAVLDRPNDRSSHRIVTVRGGGLAVAAGAVAAITLTGRSGTQPLQALLAAAVGFGLLGLIDDFLQLPARMRLGVQVLLAAGSVPWLLGGLQSPPAVKALCALVAAIWLIGYVNVFNFMDGINGLSAAQALISGCAFAGFGLHLGNLVLVIAGGAVAGGAIGFAPFNFPNAVMFLGDVGSYFIGAWLACTALLALRAGAPAEAVLAPFALYLVDTTCTLVRRISRGASWHQPHRDHTYQQLVDRGWSHTTTTLVIAAFATTISLLGSVSFSSSIPAREAAILCIAVLLCVYMRLPLWVRPHKPSSLRDQAIVPSS